MGGNSFSNEASKAVRRFGPLAMQGRIRLITRLASVVFLMVQAGEISRESFRSQTVKQLIATLNQAGQIKAMKRRCSRFKTERRSWIRSRCSGSLSSARPY